MKNMFDLSALDEMPSETKERLLKLIASQSEYFIITGSDPLDLAGCCPSDGVRAANQLVGAGILQVVQSKSTPDSCPVNIYAFSGEIKAGDSKPEFTIDREFRQKIKGYLTSVKSKRKFWHVVMRGSLLLFVAISLGGFAVNIWNSHIASKDSSNIDLIKEFDLPFQNGVLILQFHRTQRCKFCLNMEKHTNETLNTYFQDDLRDENIVFRTVDMELPRYKSLVKKYDLFTSTLVLVDVAEGIESRWKIVTEAWYLTNKNQKFIEMFRAELLEFREGRK